MHKKYIHMYTRNVHVDLCIWMWHFWKLSSTQIPCENFQSNQTLKSCCDSLVHSVNADNSYVFVKDSPENNVRIKPFLCLHNNRQRRCHLVTNVLHLHLQGPQEFIPLVADLSYEERFQIIIHEVIASTHFQKFNITPNPKKLPSKTIQN